MSEYARRVEPQTKSIVSRLEHFDIELTERCNNDCIHCCINRPAHDAEARRREMTTEQVKDILQQATDLGCLQVRFTGGEPLLRPDFNEIYVYARRLGLKVLLYTNGCLLTPHLADLFARVPPLQEIEITVYGMHPESYEAVTRTPGSFAQFRRGVDLLLQRAVPFIVKGALLPQNRHEMGEFEAWAETILWMSRRPVYALFFNFRDRRDDAGRNRLIESLRLTPQDGVSLLMRDEEAHREIAAFAAKFAGLPGDRLFKCSVCQGRNVSIDAYGRAQPCMDLRAQELTVDIAGFEERASLQDALESFTRLSDLRATNPDYLRRCARCFLNGLCEQCPARS
jgi:MoaA/NifB/PqqE/SkfB family radical SAM enzyme